MPEKSRVRGHALVWVAITKAGCECGAKFEIPQSEAADRAEATVRDWLMDEHSDHLAAIRQRMGK